MSELEKLKKRLKSLPKDFTYDEARSLLTKLGFEEKNKGRTSGSRVKFEKKNNPDILLHKPHPQNTLKRVYLQKLLETLIKSGDIKE